MIVLALDGARDGFSVALTRDGKPLATASVDGTHALEQGLALVASVLVEAGLTPAQIDRIAVGIGPGRFTGVRIAISYAKSLALAWRLPLCGVDSFDALEAGHRIEQPALTIVRGRKGVISVRSLSEGQHRRASGYINDVLADFGNGLCALQLSGDVEDVLPGLAERGWSVLEITEPIQPSALAVAMVAAQRAPAKSLHEVRADYGELPAAKIPNP